MRKTHVRLRSRFALKIESGDNFGLFIVHIFLEVRPDFGQRTVGVSLHGFIGQHKIVRRKARFFERPNRSLPGGVQEAVAHHFGKRHTALNQNLLTIGRPNGIAHAIFAGGELVGFAPIERHHKHLTFAFHGTHKGKPRAVGRPGWLAGTLGSACQCFGIARPELAEVNVRPIVVLAGLVGVGLNGCKGVSRLPTIGGERYPSHLFDAGEVGSDDFL